jgi:diacylglycerol O-acyltransferase
MDQLSPLDAAFLDAEDADPHAALAIGSVAVLPGPAPSNTEFVTEIVPRLRTVRRTQQRLLRMPFDLGPPALLDTGEFDASYHLRRTALPAPGADAELCRLVARVMSQRLDRDRPLWECWVIEGLSGGRWAVLTKLHHCLADGISGTQLLTALFTPAPVPAPEWPAEPDPTPGTQLLAVLRDIADGPFAPLRALAVGLRVPRRLAGQLTDAVTGLGRMATVLAPVAPSSLSGPLGTARRYAVARTSLTDMRAVGAAFGVTVNDVVLAAVSLAFRQTLELHGERPTARTVRAMVPVSVRTGDAMDNQLSVLLPMLPVERADPLTVLREVHRRLAELKRGKETEAGHAATALAAHEPFALVSAALRLLARLPQRNIVTVTTNVPGPTTPLSLLGRPVLELLPYVPIALRLRTGVAALSYCDRMTFGITADFDGMPEVEHFAAAVEHGVAALVTAARQEEGRSATAPRR